MQISVNLGPADVQAQISRMSHRADSNQSVEKSATSDLAPKTPKESVSGVNQAPEITPKAKQGMPEESGTNTELQVNQRGYKFNMLIERPAGTTTMQTVLNFYRTDVAAEQTTNTSASIDETA
ncbi:hypothetical protein [Neptunicella marina]|uniref:Uncharacterized protein n=1 Tax=Neptunicella marina TaxID=2125989 RepID=A0A8J6IRW6_9ALTE|nr:hypothetical protein [Neptunicella marina]MBC3764278.1 hypothetical protein [Neptunicella marina]